MCSLLERSAVAAFVSKIIFFCPNLPFSICARTLIFPCSFYFYFYFVRARPFIVLLFLARHTNTHWNSVYTKRNYQHKILGTGKRLTIRRTRTRTGSGKWGLDLIFFFPLLAVPFLLLLLQRVCFLWDNIWEFKSIIKASTWRNNLLNFFLSAFAIMQYDNIKMFLSSKFFCFSFDPTHVVSFLSTK